MISKVTLFIAAAFAASAMAGTTDVKCNTGPVQCCNQLEQANSAAGAHLFALAGVAVQDVSALVGANCTPITVIGAAGGSQCSNTPVCCKQNDIGNHGNLISIGCSPIGV